MISFLHICGQWPVCLSLIKISQILTFSTFCHQGSVFSRGRAELMMLLQMKSHKIGPVRHSSPAKIPTLDDNSFRQNSIWEFGVRRMKATLTGGQKQIEKTTKWCPGGSFSLSIKTLAVSILRFWDLHSSCCESDGPLSAASPTLRWAAWIIRHAPSQQVRVAK